VIFITKDARITPTDEAVLRSGRADGVEQPCAEERGDEEPDCNSRQHLSSLSDRVAVVDRAIYRATGAWRAIDVEDKTQSPAASSPHRARRSARARFDPDRTRPGSTAPRTRRPSRRRPAGRMGARACPRSRRGRELRARARAPRRRRGRSSWLSILLSEPAAPWLNSLGQAG
jgi:hypothetical protein